MNKLNNNIAFPCGIMPAKRFMLLPLTNTQSFEDGTPLMMNFMAYT